MPERQIAFAGARYVNAAGHVVMGIRGEVHDIPEAEIERLDALGALVPVDAELFKPGILLPLNESDSDEKIRNYLVSGNTNEILTQAATYPTSLVEKLFVAEKAGLNRDGLVQGLERRAGTIVTRGEDSVVAMELEVLRGATDARINQVVTAPADDDSTAPEDLDEFVATNTIEAVLAKAGNDPAMAEELIAIEEARGEKARSSLIEKLSKIEG